MKEIFALLILILPIAGVCQLDLPITFEDTVTIDYALSDFGGNLSGIVEDPTDSMNLVVQSVKNSGEIWAGTTIGSLGLASRIPFDEMNTKMSVKIWSPTTGTPVRLKVESASDEDLFVETQVHTTLAEEWDTLEFDFANAMEGNLDLEVDYDKISIFFDFGSVGDGQIYYFDDIVFSGGGGLGDRKDQMNLPITFQDTATVEYKLADFAGNVSFIATDPTDENNLVGQTIKTTAAETFAGTVVGSDGLASAIPFTENESLVTVQVWSPDAGTPIMLKVENSESPGINIETQDTTRTSGEWETLEFDFSTPTVGEYDLDRIYDKLVIFFNYGATDTIAKTYYWDDINFLKDTGLEVLDFEEAGISVSPNPAFSILHINFENDLGNHYRLKIFDSWGRLVSQGAVSGSEMQLDVSGLNAGIYYLNIHSSAHSYIQKVSIVR